MHTTQHSSKQNTRTMSEEKEVVPPPAVVDGEEGENAEEDKPTLEAPEPITVQYCPGGKQQRVCVCVCVSGCHFDN